MVTFSADDERVELLEHVTELIRGTLGSPWLWVLVFAIAGLDALLPFMPSETTVVTVAVLIGPDLGRLALLVVVSAAGAWAGDCLGYAVGRAAGPRAVAGCSADRPDGNATNGPATRSAGKRRC